MYQEKNFVAKVEENGAVLKVMYDTDAPNPREMGSYIGRMVCHHRRYALGDEEAKNIRDYTNWKDWFSGEIGKEDDFIRLPLYLYDHSGITMSTKDFGDRWDSGQVGWIYVSKKDARREFGWKRITEKRRKEIEEILRAEVEEYDQYLRGEVYGYVLEDESGERIESCWGFYGPNARDMIRSAVPSQYRYLAEKLPQYL